MIDENIYTHCNENYCTDRLDRHLRSESFKSELIDFYVRFEQSMNLPDLVGKTVEVNSEQFSDIYEVIWKQSKILDIEMPRIYVFESFYYDANAEGLNSPWIQISAKTVTDFTPEELAFTLARQMIHIKKNHLYWEVLSEQFIKILGMSEDVVGSLVGFFPGGQTISKEAMDTFSSKFKLVSSQWSRVSEYTADFGAYLITGNIEAAVSAIKKHILNNKKLASTIRLKSYLNQTKRICEMTDPFSKYSIYDEMVPYGPFRIKELLRFASNLDVKKAIKSIENN